MKNASLLESMPKLIMTITIVVLVGTLFGTLGYYLGNKNIAKNTPADVKYQKDLAEKENEKEMENNKQEDADFLEKIADWKTYQNEKYGFEMKFPQSWKGYKVFEESWDGTTLDSNFVEYEGPKIVIRNPKWSEDKIWQDIPILVFTKDEWQLIEAANLNIFSAPIAPRKLGENNKYIFALPPRWIGFTDASGQDEAQKIVETFKLLDLDKTKDLETYDGSKTKIGSGFSFKYSPEVWNLKELRFVHKNLDGCILAPSVLWRNRLVNIISSENITLSNYKARKVKIGIEDNASSIDYYLDSETSAVFSLSLPENKKDKTTCEKDTEAILNTISF